MIAGHVLFLGAAAVGVAVTVITEGLSLGHRLTPGWLGVCWGVAGALGLAAFRARRRGAPSAPPAPPMPRSAAAVVGAILAVTGIIALLAPPNNWDSMTYHMPRVAHWSQAGSVAHYPTHILRQLWLGPWAEFAITHLYLLAGGDRLANLVQWLAFSGCVAGAAVVARELGGGPWARAGATVATATLPMAIAQASSTQNDLVGSFWLLSLGYWVLRFRATPSASTAVLIGVSAGLAGLTKLPVWFLALPWLVAFVASAAALGRRRALAWIVVAGVIAGVLNAGHVGRTARLLWDGDGPAASDPAGHHDRLPPVWTRYANTTLDPRAVVSNALRNVALHLATPSERVNAWVEHVIVGAHRVLGIDPNDPRTTLGGGFPEFHVGPWLLHEDFTGNPLHLLAGVVVGVILWRRRAVFGAPVRRWAWLSLASAVAFVVVLKWQPWNSRLHLPLFVLWAPLVGVALEPRRRLAVAWAVCFCLLALPSLAVTWPRTLIGPDSVLTMPRTAQRFRNHPKLQPVYEAAVGVVGDMRCQRVGLILGWDDLEYPFWPLFRARLGPDFRMEHVLVRNASARLGPAVPDAPCALLVVGGAAEGPVAWRGETFVEHWRWWPVRVYQPER